ncbi:hypothetical protein EMQ25_09420 [Arsenicitalea aurantiaca]|uniref:Calcineurin-like phosphoesterase domain-containing protein n=1 Tax=Arsenicitalea aurantiaca TaxID=1783274 RepID=A0A433XAI3_9HYPH|nr:metallophosphoesterase [Arsenicitalea aurantiaca]RUT31086.1 hypothetical protein EMQ25_09420 [Arsenicitalea aurantiaca]
MKISIVTDIHHGPLSHTKLEGWNALEALETAIDWAEAEGADLLLDLGDHISDTSPEADRQVMAEVVETFARTALPRVHVLGNHDVANLSVADNEAIFGVSMQNRVIDLGEFRLLAWQPDVRITRPHGFAATAPHLDWLVETLLADERPAIVATHVPVSGHSQIGNYYFQNNPQYASYPDHALIREAVEATGRVAAWLSGHVHWNTVTSVAGIRHITIQSLSERFTTMPRPAGAHAMLEIADGMLSLRVHGEDPFEARMPFAASGVRPWMAPHRPFTAVETDREVEHA